MKGDRPRSSTDYVREFRKRMRESGLVKREVWIRPERAPELTAIEKQLRQPPGTATALDEERSARPGWTVHALAVALAATRPVLTGRVTIELIEGAEPSLHLVMHDYGDLPVFVAIGGEQIIVQVLMWPVDDVVDTAAFDMHVLRTHKLLPLSTMGIEPIGGVMSYIMFGSLDTHSSLANVLFEIETLAENVLSAAESYAPFLRPELLDEAAA
ncbi:YjfI family protein [Cognatilysobacter terrigena]|uniref:YjfI family protein n=1 Tax=Cognatilysobacter terrigena TaxID=2488749 RepID=UPI00105F238A|nr:YjfI family protein [Lysobacter terrigena]